MRIHQNGGSPIPETTRIYVWIKCTLFWRVWNGVQQYGETSGLKKLSHLERKQRRTYVNIVSMLVMTMMTFALLDEVLFWMRCHQLRLEAREAMDRLIEVLETQNNEHLYSSVL